MAIKNYSLDNGVYPADETYENPRIATICSILLCECGKYQKAISPWPLISKIYLISPRE